MFRQCGGFLLLAFFLPLLVRAADEGRLMTYPDIHGTTIVFTYEGDLWTTTTAGGTAARLTSHPGREFAARFSPDGATLAFTAQYDDGTNAYLMPAGGGTPTRLTYLPRPVQTLCVDTGRFTHHFPLDVRYRHFPGSDALWRRQNRHPARTASRRPRCAVQLLARRCFHALLPPRERGVLLEALQGGTVPGYLAV